MPVTNLTVRHRLAGWWLSSLLLVAAGCAAPAPNESAVQTPATASAAEAVAATGGNSAVQPLKPAPPMSDPLPPLRAPHPASKPARKPAPASVPAGQPVVIDTRCTTHADCTIKNVGNCCGEYPACVNVDSPTDPAAVQAQCAQRGMASVCGFPAITACQCVAGECKGDNAAVVE